MNSELYGKDSVKDIKFFIISKVSEAYDQVVLQASFDVMTRLVTKGYQLLSEERN